MGILQARILEWVAMPSSRGSSPPRDQTCVSCVSCIGRWILHLSHHLGSMGFPSSYSLYSKFNSLPNENLNQPSAYSPVLHSYGLSSLQKVNYLHANTSLQKLFFRKKKIGLRSFLHFFQTDPPHPHRPLPYPSFNSSISVFSNFS